VHNLRAGPESRLASMTYTCIYRLEPFEAASGEHILQNSMGARWQSSTIVCNEVQTLFANTLDTALQEGFQEFRLLLGSKGGRRGDPKPIRVKTTTGKPALLIPGGQAKLASPVVTRSSENLEQFQIEISAKKDLGWVAAQIREHYPDINMAALIAALNEGAQDPSLRRPNADERLVLSPRLGGPECFRGMLKSLFNLLGVNNRALALEPIFDAVRTFILTGDGNFRAFVRWPVQAPPELPRLGDFDQFIAVYSRGPVVEGFAQFFGAINWTFRLATGYTGPKFCHAYCVDPLRRATPAEDRAPRVTSDSFMPFDDGRADIDQSTIDCCQEQVAAFLRRHVQRSRLETLKSDLPRIIREALGPPDGRILTLTDIRRVSEAVASAAIASGFPIPGV
jgi:hypothetical protein